MNKKQKKTLITLIICTVLLVAIKITTGLVFDNISIPALAENIITISAYAVPYLISGRKVLFKALRSIKNGHVLDENLLMSIATIGAFILGEYADGVAVMIFYQVGQLFENIAVNKSRNAITSLVNLRPDYVNIERDGKLEQVDPYDVMVGDRIVVLAGEKIPLDGIIVEGDSFVDTSALTGESVPRHVGIDDSILSGCINKNGRLVIEVTKEFDDSTVAKILDMVENASTRKSKSESFITRFARYYTPFVVFSALAVAVIPPIVLSASFMTWLERALVFLVISCPCALVISVPLGFFGGIGAASKMGILVKGSNYLEAIAKADTIVFDKTGTLTEGVFKVNDIVAAGTSGIDEDRLLFLAAYAESNSNHPIAASVLTAFNNRGNVVDLSRISDVAEIAGKGVSICLDGNKIYAGNKKLLDEFDIKYDSELMDAAKEAKGTVVFVADSKECLGYISISDVVKPDAKNAINRLHSQGIKKSVMLTGDREAAAESVARELGIRVVRSELLPDQKLSNLEDIMSESEEGRVIFVGDGINDAPSLTRADIGIAMGALGQDAAIEAADIVLMDDNPAKIVTARHIGRKTLAIVKQNIVFALSVKLLAMVLGVLGVAGMWFAVFADVGVSVIAILNSMRMLNYKEKI